MSASTTPPQAATQTQVTPPPEPNKIPVLTTAGVMPGATAAVSAETKTATVATDEIIARPLVDDDFTGIAKHLVNKALQMRWGNRVAGSGARYSQLLAMGFRPAVLTDFVKDSVPKHLMRDGVIINGDVIALVIDKNKYLGALKYNEQKAVARLGSAAVLARGRKELGDALNEVPGSPANKGKVKPFTPEF